MQIDSLHTRLHRLGRKAFLVLGILFLFFIAGCSARDARLYSSSYKKVRCDYHAYGFENLCEDEKQYLDLAEASYAEYSGLFDLNRSVLRKITQETEDVDVATGVFYSRALRDPKTRSLLLYLKKKEKEYKRHSPDYSGSGFSLAMVPGMFYKENPDVGADGRVIRAVASKMGIPSDLIPVGSTSSILANADIICGFIKETSREKIIVASSSKGGADFKMAMETCGKEPYFRKVKGWFNIGGLLRGTFALNMLDDEPLKKRETRLLFFFKGYDWRGLMDLHSGKGSLLDRDLFIPDHLVLVNVIGTPLFRFVTPSAQPNFLYLNRYGPSDGYVLLADTIIPGAYLYPVWRNDHYFARGMPAERIEALFAFMIEHARR